MPLAGWCGAVRVFARGAEPLAGNCCLVAGQWLSPSGEYRQPANIIVPRGFRCRGRITPTLAATLTRLLLSEIVTIVPP